MRCPAGIRAAPLADKLRDVLLEKLDGPGREDSHDPSDEVCKI